MGSDLREVIAELLPLITDANQRLGLSREVPLDLQAVVAKTAQGFSSSLPETSRDMAAAGLNPYLVQAVLRGLLTAYAALAEPDTKASQLRVGLEQVRQGFGRLLEEMEPTQSDDALEAAQWLSEVLPSHTDEVADVLGTTSQQFRAWMSGRGSPDSTQSAKLLMLARLVVNLRQALTEPGVLVWLREVHPDLEAPPAELLSNPENYPRLLRLATRIRAHTAA